MNLGYLSEKKKRRVGVRVVSGPTLINAFYVVKV